MVKAGKHTESQEPVAVKLITKTNLTTIEKNTVKIEAEVMSYIIHKNIVSLFAVFENRNQICMVMEYAGGGELLDYITRRTRLSEIEARKFFTQLLDGIGYAHSKRIIHRDIKAENVFLDQKLEMIKIGDWGFAGLYKSDQVSSSDYQCGTLNYAAPEILSQRSTVGPEVDVWALGVLLYFMVCGWLPFRGTTDFEVFSKIKKGDYKILPRHISEDLKDLIEQIFNVDRLTRPTIDVLQRHPWCLQVRVDPEYHKRPRLPRLLLHEIKHYQFKPKINLQTQPSKPLLDNTNIKGLLEPLENSNHHYHHHHNKSREKRKERNKITRLEGLNPEENKSSKKRNQKHRRKRKEDNKRIRPHHCNYHIEEEEEIIENSFHQIPILSDNNNCTFPEDIILDSPISLKQSSKSRVMKSNPSLFHSNTTQKSPLMTLYLRCARTPQTRKQDTTWVLNELPSNTPTKSLPPKALSQISLKSISIIDSQSKSPFQKKSHLRNIKVSSPLKKRISQNNTEREN